MVPVGVIGLSPEWETRFRPALKSLRNRIVVRAVYDPVLGRAEQAAGEFGAVAVAGMRALACRDDLKALLVFDTGWYGAEAIRILCQAGKPILIGGHFSPAEATLDRLSDAAVTCETMVMPALSSRYTPATFRLRELIATRLGRPLQIEIRVDSTTLSSDGHDFNGLGREDVFAQLSDWCCHVIPTPPTEVSTFADVADKAERLQFTFAQPRSGGVRPTAEIQIVSSSRREPAETGEPTFRVLCERGDATLVADDRIVWQTSNEGGDESLAADRTAMQVMLDHFCRRVVGGLIPVADLDDLRRSRWLMRTAIESRRTGSPISLNGQS